MDRLFDVPADDVDAGALEQIDREGKAPAKKQQIAIARGLAYDPHVDGRLRLTPVGLEVLAGARSPS